MKVEWLIVLMAGCLGVVPAFGAEGTRNLSVDDILKIEDFGQVEITRDNEFVLFERMPAYREGPNIDAIWPIDRRAQATIYAADVASRHTSVTPLFTQASNVGYWMGPMSPSGSHLAVYSLAGGALRAGAVDLSSRKVNWFDFTPDCCFQVAAPVWLSDEEIIYVGIPSDESASILSRSVGTRSLEKMWHKSLEGKEATATVLESTPNGLAASATPRRGSIVRVNIRTGQAVPIAQLYAHELELSPDKRYLAAVIEYGFIQPSAAVPLIRQRLGLRIYDLTRPDTGRVAAEVPCASCTLVNKDAVEWSAHDSRLSFLARELSDDGEQVDLYQYSVASHALLKLDHGDYHIGCTTDSGRMIAGAEGVAAFARRKSADERAGALRSCFKDGRHDWIYLRPGHPPINLSQVTERPSGVPLALIDNQLFIAADDGIRKIRPNGQVRALRLRYPMAPLNELNKGGPGQGPLIVEGAGKVARLDLPSERLQVLEKPNSEAELRALSHDGSVGVFRSSVRGATKLSVTRVHEGTREVLLLNSHLADVAVPRQVEFSYEVGGVKLSSCALLPNGAVPGVRLPTVVHLYPATTDSCIVSELGEVDPDSMTLLASKGYLVLFPAMPISLLRDPAGVNHGVSELLIAAVDAATKAGYVDSSKIGLFGFSYGFPLVLQALIDNPTRFKAAIARSGVADFASDYGTIPLGARFGHSIFQIGNFGMYEGLGLLSVDVPPWAEPSIYVKNSAIFFADKIQTPLLLINSDFDQMSIVQSEEIFSALYRQRKPAEYVTYWGEGHGNLSPANIIDQWARMESWYSRYLH